MEKENSLSWGRTMLCAISLGLIYGILLLPLTVGVFGCCKTDRCGVDDVPELIKEGKIANLPFVTDNKSMQFTFEDGQVIFIKEIEKESLKHLRIGQTGRLLTRKIKNSGCLCGRCKRKVYYWEIL